MCDFVTPGQVTGMGNPTAPGENGEVGSGDMLTIKEPKKKDKKRKMKSLKDYLKKNGTNN